MKIEKLISREYKKLLDTKITKSDIIKVREHLKKQWNDQAWWDFHKLPKTSAISQALYSLDGSYGGDRSYCGIAAEAEEILKLMEEVQK